MNGATVCFASCVVRWLGLHTSIHLLPFCCCTPPQLQLDDVVKVIRGAARGQSGTVRHVYRNHLFLYSRQHPENNGIWAQMADQVVLMTGGANSAASAASAAAGAFQKPMTPARGTSRRCCHLQRRRRSEQRAASDVCCVKQMVVWAVAAVAAVLEVVGAEGVAAAAAFKTLWWAEWSWSHVSVSLRCVACRALHPLFMCFAVVWGAAVRSAVEGSDRYCERGDGRGVSRRTA
jgi:hypothetical protein